MLNNMFNSVFVCFISKFITYYLDILNYAINCHMLKLVKLHLNFINPFHRIVEVLNLKIIFVREERWRR